MKIINIKGVDYTLSELRQQKLLDRPDVLFDWIANHKPTDVPTKTRLGDTLIHIKPDLLGDTHYILTEVPYDSEYQNN